MQQDTKEITKTLIKRNYSNKFLVKKIKRFPLLKWKDEKIISYDKINSLRNDLGLKKIIPSKTSLHSFKNALNSQITKRYNVKYTENSIVIENIHQLLQDYVKFINQKDIKIKWMSRRNFMCRSCRRNLFQPSLISQISFNLETNRKQRDTHFI